MDGEITLFSLFFSWFMVCAQKAATRDTYCARLRRESTEQKKERIKHSSAAFCLELLLMFFYSNRPKKCMRVLKAFALTQWQNKTVHFVFISHRAMAIEAADYWVISILPVFSPEVKIKLQIFLKNCEI